MQRIDVVQHAHEHLTRGGLAVEPLLDTRVIEFREFVFLSLLQRTTPCARGGVKPNTSPSLSRKAGAGFS